MCMNNEKEDTYILSYIIYLNYYLYMTSAYDFFSQLKWIENLDACFIVVLKRLGLKMLYDENRVRIKKIENTFLNIFTYHLATQLCN